MELKYIPVIGLEIHIQLNLENKMFSPEKFDYGVISNTLISNITMAYPGTLPQFNKNVIDSALKLGVACDCNITNLNYFSRKNYFYPDLPKGYQITQDDTPICRNGKIFYDVDNKEKCINLTRIHIEEDTANLKVIKKSSEIKEYNNRSIYNNNGDEIFIDYNRCGVALLELVTEPEFRSSDEVFCFLHELRRLVRFLNISNGNMEEGSLRCDVNISLMKENDTKFGNRVEIKNINSISNVKNAIEFEIIRQSNLLKNNEAVDIETRMFIAEDNSTKKMRSKESSDDYHYIRDYDLNPVYVSDEDIDKIKNSMSLLPRQYRKKLINEYNLSTNIADIFIEDIPLLKYYEELCNYNNFKHYDKVANWLLGPIKGILNEYKLDIEDIKISKENIIELIQLVLDNKVNYSTASQIILKKMFEDYNKTPIEIAKELNLIQDLNEDNIKILVDEVLEKYKDRIDEYRNGKKGLLGVFIGEVIKKSNGKANPKHVQELILKSINN